MKIYKTVLLLGAAFLFVLYIGCSKPTETTVAGDGSQTGNAFAGRILYQDGTPAAGVTVRICPVDYTPSLSKTNAAITAIKTTDKDGYYHYDDLDTGSYNVDASLESLGVFIDSILIAKDSGNCSVPNGILKKLGTITGISHMPGQSDTNQVRVNIYMPGTRRIALPNIGGKFVFDMMPEGRYQIIVNPTLPTYNVRIIDTTLNAGQNLDLDTVLLRVFEPDTIEINGNTVSGTWGPNKTYRLNKYTEIPQGETLSVLPNTHIIITGGVLANKGSFIAIGEETKPITISSVGYDLSNTNTASVFICKHCIVTTPVYLFPHTGQQTSLSNCILKMLEIAGDSSMIADTTIRIFNNIIENSVRAAVNLRINSVELNHGSFNIFLRNNIFYHSEYAFLVTSNSIGINSDYNCFYEITTAFSDTVNGVVSVPLSHNDKQQDPRFTSINADAKDYHLLPDSPCKGTGVNGTDMGIFSTYEP